MLRLLALFGIYLPMSLCGQQASISKPEESFVKTMGAQAELYRGAEHIPYPSKNEGFAYYENSEWQKGIVVYKGIEYKNLNLKYDLVKDELVVLHPNGYFPIVLQTAKVDTFKIADKQFVNIRAANPFNIKPGYYEILHEGKLTLLAKRTKLVEESTARGELHRRFTNVNDYFLLMEGKSQNVTNEHSVFSFLNEHTNKIRTHLRQNDIRFRKDKEFALLVIATYYNQLEK